MLSSRLLIAALIAALAGAGTALLWERNLMQRMESKLRTEEAINRQLRQPVKQQTVPCAPRAAEKEPAEPAPEKPPRRPPETGSALDVHDNEIQRLRAMLTETQAALEKAQSRVLSLQDLQARQADSDRERGAAVETEWKRRVEESAQLLQHAQAEADTYKGRVAELEKSVQQLRADQQTLSGVAAQNAKAATELEDIARRREAYLTSILRRYRDITNQFRSMSAVMRSAGPQQSAPLSDTELTRILSTLSLTESDLRQLDLLNAQARQIELRSAKK